MIDSFKKSLGSSGSGGKKGRLLQVFFRPVLTLLSSLYGGATRIRSMAYEREWWKTRRLSVPVVSIGNLVAGGTGKTPMTSFIARAVQKRGYRAVILSRGYKGLAEQKGGVVSDGHRVVLSPRMAGDEPFMMASALPGIPVIVGKDRFQSGKLALTRFKPDLILLDDGFQHIRLARDLNILLLDSRRPLGNGHLIPRGVLREAPAAIERADAVIMTRTVGKQKKKIPEVGSYLGEQPLFYATHQPLIQTLVPAHKKIALPLPGPKGVPPHLSGLRVFAFSAIARNDEFIRSVKQLGGELVGNKSFTDHYHYLREDLLTFDEMAKKTGASAIATTAKDLVRIEPGTRFSLDLFVLDVAIQFARSDFIDYLFDILTNLIPSR